MSGLFDSSVTENASAPLAERLRPVEMSQVVGQAHLLEAQGALARMCAANHFHSVILWGPPGCGKTTLAKIIAAQSGYELKVISAITSGVSDLKVIFQEAKLLKQDGKRSLLFVDEIHRFNRAQQDAFLPVVEDGTITLIGATTENPSFELNAALLSRCKLLVLKRLSEEALEKLLQRAEGESQKKIPLTIEAREMLCAMADGDGRYLLNMAEEIFAASSFASKQADGSLMDVERLVSFIQKRAPVYDKKQEGHYNLISALHKAVRGSDVQGALYWLTRMLKGGEDPLYLARRLVRMAVEDIGMAEPQALNQCMAAMQAYEFLGSPEGELALGQATVFLAMAPKSNAAYVAYKQAAKDAEAFGSLMPPKHILNAPTKMMKNEGYGEGYLYDPDQPDGFSGQDYFPEEMGRRHYYQPVPRGYERDMQKRLNYWDKLRSERQLSRKE